jgi:alkylation response protein AidB-like acyl-CoA dehydrogenase
MSEDVEAPLLEVERFAQARLNDELIARDRECRFSREAWRACAELGVLGLPFPAEYGGAGADVLTTSRTMEALGFGCRDNGLLFSLNAQLWSVQLPLWKFGTPEQKLRWLPRLCSGECIGAHGMTEPDSGSDAFGLRTTALADGDGYRLSGTKTFVTNAPVADLFVLFARVGQSQGFLGVTAFLVERGSPGLQVGRPIETMGLRTSPMAEVVLDGCRVPAGNRLGGEGDGARIFALAMAWERACLLATAVGAMRRQLDTCIRYARMRRQFGRPIGKFQSVANRIVDMRLRWATSRLLLHRVARLSQDGADGLQLEAATAKLHISESWVASCLDAIQIHGGYGYATESEIERELRDAVASRLYSGTSEIQRNLIAGALGL